MTTPAPAECPGSRRGTSLADFITRGDEWLAPCGVCGLKVSIAIDGRAVPHATRVKAA